MTKEELRTRLLELEKEIQDDYKASTLAEYDKLLYKLSDVLFEELGDTSVKVIVEKVFDRYDIDLDHLASEYLDCGDLEQAFKEVADLEDDFEVTKTIIK